MALFVPSSVGLVCLGVVVWRILKRRRRRRTHVSKPETPIGRLIEQLVSDVMVSGNALMVLMT